MVDKIIFTHPSQLYPSELYPQDWEKRKSQAHQLKLKNHDISKVQLENWLYEMASQGIDISRIQMQFPTGSLFGDMKIPRNEQQSNLLATFEAVKADIKAQRDVVFDQNMYLFSENWKTISKLKVLFAKMDEPFDFETVLANIKKWEKNVDLLKQVMGTELYLNPVVKQDIVGFLNQIKNSQNLSLCVKMNEHGLLNASNLEKIANNHITRNMLETEIWKKQDAITPEAIQAMLNHPQTNDFFRIMDEIWKRHPNVDISKLILHLSQMQNFNNLDIILNHIGGIVYKYKNLFKDISYLEASDPQAMVDLIVAIKNAPKRHINDDEYELMGTLIQNQPENLFRIQALLKTYGIHHTHELIVKDKLLECSLGKKILENIDKFHDLLALQSVLDILMHTSQDIQNSYENDFDKLVNMANDTRFMQLYSYLNQQQRSFKEALVSHPHLMNFLMEHPSPTDVVYVLEKFYPFNEFNEACEKIIHCSNVTTLANNIQDHTLGMHRKFLLTNFEGLFSNPDLDGFANCLRILQNRYRGELTEKFVRLLELNHLTDFSRQLQAHPELIPYFYEMIVDRNLDTQKIQHLMDDVWTEAFLNKSGQLYLKLFANNSYLYQVFEYGAQSHSPKDFFKVINELYNEIPVDTLKKLADHPNLDKVYEFLQMKKLNRPYDESYYQEYHLDRLLDDDILNVLPTLRWMLIKGSHSMKECVELIKNVPEIIALGERYDSSLLDIYQYLKSKSLDANLVIRQICELPHGAEFCAPLMNTPNRNNIIQGILQSGNIFERSELMYRLQYCSAKFSRFVLLMPRPEELYRFLMTIPHEQQNEVLTRIDQLGFLNAYYCQEGALALITSSTQPLQLIDVMEHYFSRLKWSINEYTLNSFSNFIKRFNPDELIQASDIIKLFLNKKDVFEEIGALIDQGVEFDSQILRHIGENKQAYELVVILKILHHYDLLIGEQGQINIGCLFEHEELYSMLETIQKLIQKGPLTQDLFEKLNLQKNKLSEKTHDPFIGVDANNQVHIYMPLTNGVEICTDNTCKSAEALRASMGYINGQQSIELSIKEYIADLKKDIALLRPESKLCRQKEERVKQLENYQSSFNDVKCLPDIQSLSSIYPEYPDGMKAIMCRPDANLSSMQLSPRIMDGYLRMVNPTFSLRIIDREAIEPLLRDVLSKMDFPPEASRETFIQLVLSKLTEPKVRLTDFEELLSRETENEFGYPIKYEIEQFTPALRATLNEMTFPPSDIRAPFIQGILRQVEAEPEMSYERLQDILTAQTELTFGEKVNYRGVTIQSIYDIMGDDTLDVNNDAGTFVEALLGFAAPELFNMAPRGPFQQRFDGSQEEDRLSITVQFYLAEINMYCHQHDISHQNFGLLLQNTDLRTAFLECLRGCTLETIEHRLFEFVSQHHVEFELSRPLDMNDFKTIQRDFYVHFSSVMGSPHYDEFSVLNFEKNGGFYSHGGKICVDYLDYLKEAIPNHTLNQAPQMQEILAQSKQLPVNTFHPVEKIKDLSLEEKKERVEQGYPLGFLLGELNESQQVELLSDFGKFALYILEGSRPEMQNLNGNIAPAALSYLQDVSIAHDKSNMFKLNAEQMACRDTLERLSQAYPEESNWLRALLIRDANLVSRGLEHFPSMPSKFIDAVFGQKTLLARINHVLEERDAPPLKKPEDLAAYRNVTADFKQRMPKQEESSSEFKPNGPS